MAWGSRTDAATSSLRYGTQWLFTWGKQEIGTYSIEAEEQRTAKVISHLPNVTTQIFDVGHVFPTSEISQWLNETQLSGLY